jgi:putative component of membrane protein insertase Oxa1/YidC/SpoIIIJ protein YidD
MRVRGWLLTLAVAGCSARNGMPSRNIVDARFVIAGQQGRQAPETATATYRTVLAKTLGSHCRMLPSDSEYFDRKVKQCGAVAGVMAGVSRVLLEVEATAEVAEPVPATKRLYWLDPPRSDSCWR